MPVMAPVDEPIARPAGNEGDTLKVYGLTPKLPVTGVNEAADAFRVKVFEAIACVALTGEVTVRSKLPVATALLASVAVTV